MDVFFVSAFGSQVPVLNIIDHGTNLQICTILKAVTADQVWSGFVRAWLRPLGVPEIVMTDGGSEFEAGVIRGLEELGGFHHICDAESPWQNGRCERHGGLAKKALFDRLERGF